jgi:hypothetical protein
MAFLYYLREYIICALTIYKLQNAVLTLTPLVGQPLVTLCHPIHPPHSRWSHRIRARLLRWSRCSNSRQNRCARSRCWIRYVRGGCADSAASTQLRVRSGDQAPVPRFYTNQPLVERRFQALCSICKLGYRLVLPFLKLLWL